VAVVGPFTQGGPLVLQLIWPISTHHLVLAASQEDIVADENPAIWWTMATFCVIITLTKHRLFNTPPVSFQRGELTILIPDTWHI
jgi:hypothetical protein